MNVLVLEEVEFRHKLLQEQNTSIQRRRILFSQTVAEER